MSVGRIENANAAPLGSLNVRTTAHAGTSAPVKTVGEHVLDGLFGRPPPRVLDLAQFPQLVESMARMTRYRRKFATFAGDPESDYEEVLADDTIAAVDQHGTIFVGAGFLLSAEESVLMGALAHEVGHRPRLWRHERYRQHRNMSGEEVQALLLNAETRADIFAGRALASVGLPAQPLADFLMMVQKQPHPEYLPAAMRAQVICDAHAAQKSTEAARRKLFAEFDRFRNVRNYIGEF